MASVREVRNRHGSVRYRFCASNGSRRDCRTQEEACRMLYLDESERFANMTAKEKEACQDWTLRKLIQFFAGKKADQFETNRIRRSSLDTITYALFSVDEALQDRLALHIRPSEFRALPDNTLKHLRSAYALLIAMRKKGVNPVPVGIKRDISPVSVPAFHNVDLMIEAAETREKIAFLLASKLGLRISEILALDYSDIQGAYLSVTKHLTRHGVVIGMKADIQRRLPLPESVLTLIDMKKNGSREPLLATSSGQRLSLNYSTQGVVKQLLDKFGINRFHDLRHYASVSLLDKGEDLGTVSKVLGHKSIRTTEDIYGRGGR